MGYFIKVFGSVVILLGLSNMINGQCTSGNNGGALPSLTSSYQTIGVTSYDYYTFSASANDIITFSFCATDGGTADFDTQLTIRYDSDDSYASGYNDDNCGTLSKITWEAPTTATYRIMVSKFDCSTATTGTGTLAFKKEEISFINTTGNWNVAANWSGGAIPTLTDNVTIPNGSTVTIPNNSEALCNNLTIESGATLIYANSNTGLYFDINGDLLINGTYSHTGSEALHFHESGTIGGSGTINNMEAENWEGTRTLIGSVDIEYFSNMAGTILDLDAYTLICRYLDNDGTFYLGSGTCQYEGPDANLDILTGTFYYETGTFYYGSGNSYPAVNQTVIGIFYYDLHARTNNGFTVTLGDFYDVYAHDFLVHNPSTAGGVISTNDDVLLTGDLTIGSSGNGLIFNIDDDIIGSGGTFTMGNNNDHEIEITYALSSFTAISGFVGNTFYGTVTYNNASDQRIIDGTYNNLVFEGAGTKYTVNDLDINGDVTLTTGLFESGDGTNVQTKFETNSLIGASVPEVAGGVAAGNTAPSVATLDANSVQTEVYIPAAYSGFGLESIYVYIDHTYNADLDIYLEDPDGTVHVLATNKGSSKNGYLGVTFVTSGGSTLPTGGGGGGISGTYNTEVMDVAGYAGTINGLWTLHVVDDATGDTGTIDDFYITLTSPVNYNDLTVAGDWVMGTGTFGEGQSEVTFDGAVTQNVNAALKDLDWYDLTIASPDVLMNVDDEFGMSVANDFTVNAGAKHTNFIVDDHANDFAFMVSGHLLNNGTIDETNSDFYLGMDGTAKTIGGTGTFTSFWLHIKGTITDISDITIYQVLISATYTYSVNSGITFSLERDLLNNGTLTMTGTATIQLMDDWINTGTVNENSSLVVFNGPSNYIQDITAGGELFNDVTFDSDYYIRLKDAVTINGDVTFTDGLVKPNTTEILNLGSAATVTGASDESHCTGSVAKTTVATSWFTFPVGDGIYYRSIGVSPSSTSSTVFTATYNLGQAYTYTWVDDNNGVIDHASNVEYWDLDRAGTANATIELSWNGRSDVDNLSELLVGHWDPALNAGSGAWESAGNTATTGGTGAGTIRSQVNWSSYSPVALASSTSNNTLPVELVSFNAFCQNSEVTIDWITSSELLNDYFLLEKSIDGIAYDPIAMMDGAGTSTEINNYSHTDPKGLDLAYYRLTQVDFDGTEKKSEVISTVCKVDNFGITNISSASNNGIFSIEFLAKEAYELSVYDMRGRKVLTYLGDNSETVESTEILNLANMNSGIYQVVLVSNGKFSTDKILR